MNKLADIEGDREDCHADFLSKLTMVLNTCLLLLLNVFVMAILVETEHIVEKTKHAGEKSTPKPVTMNETAHGVLPPNINSEKFHFTVTVTPSAPTTTTTDGTQKGAATPSLVATPVVTPPPAPAVVVGVIPAPPTDNTAGNKSESESSDEEQVVDDYVPAQYPDPRDNAVRDNRDGQWARIVRPERDKRLPLGVVLIPPQRLVGHRRDGPGFVHGNTIQIHEAPVLIRPPLPAHHADPRNYHEPPRRQDVLVEAQAYSSPHGDHIVAPRRGEGPLPVLVPPRGRSHEEVPVRLVPPPNEVPRLIHPPLERPRPPDSEHNLDAQWTRIVRPEENKDPPDHLRSHIKPDYIVQQRIHRSDDKDVQASKELSLLKLVRNREYKIQKARPIYRETVFMGPEQAPPPDPKIRGFVLVKPEEAPPGQFQRPDRPHQPEPHNHRNRIVPHDDGRARPRERSFVENTIVVHVPQQKLTEEVYLPNELAPRSELQVIFS